MTDDVGYYPARELLKTWIAEDSKLPPTVTIDTELLDDVARTLEGLAKAPFGKMSPCFCYLGDVGIVIGDEGQVEHCGTCGDVFQLLARVRAAREGDDSAL